MNSNLDFDLPISSDIAIMDQMPSANITTPPAPDLGEHWGNRDKCSSHNQSSRYSCYFIWSFGSSPSVLRSVVELRETLVHRPPPPPPPYKAGVTNQSTNLDSGWTVVKRRERSQRSRCQGIGSTP
ncbi:hypothetical protein FOPE_05636 [Fonsecaea pedrosoi]|nr:hypothetical protein FOPE_05636 [Fonsecaea pedrosoi]